MDEKTKQKQSELINLVSAFCQDNLNDGFQELAVKLVEKMGRKREVPFKRGKLEIWASGVIYTLAQVNFLFDKNSPFHISANDICDYFGTKKSTVSKKGSAIYDMFNLHPFHSEFSLNQNDLTEDSAMPSENMDKFFDEVYRLFENDQSDKALAKLDKIDKNHPEYPRALFYKSVILDSIGDDSAEELLTQSLVREAENNLGVDGETTPEEYFKKGFMQYNLGNFEEALHLFNLSVSLKPNQSESLYYKSLALARLEDFEEAVEVIDKAIEIDSKDDRFWNDKGNYLSRLGKMDEAFKCFDKSIELNPNDSVLWANKGFLYRENEMYEEALESYDNACKIDPFSIHNILGKVNVYIETGDLVNAKKYLRMVSKIDSEDIEYLTAMAHFMWEQKKYDESIHYWDKCLEITDEPEMIWIYKAMVYSDADNAFEAENCIGKAIEIDPTVVFLLEDLLDEFSDGLNIH